MRDLHELPFRTAKIVLAFFVVMSGNPGKSWIEEQQTYNRLTQHHVCEPTLVFLLCCDDPALAEAISVGLVKSARLRLLKLARSCKFVISPLALLHILSTWSRSAALVRREKELHRRVISAAILAVVAADAEGSRVAVDAVEAKDAVYSETASVASMSGKASPGSEFKGEDHWPAHATRRNPVTGEVNEKFSAIREPFLDDVYGDIKGTKTTPVGIRARVLPALNSLLDMSAAYQAGLMVVTHMSSASSASTADGKTASAYRYKY